MKEFFLLFPSANQWMFNSQNCFETAINYFMHTCQILKPEVFLIWSRWYQDSCLSLLIIYLFISLVSLRSCWYPQVRILELFTGCNNTILLGACSESIFSCLPLSHKTAILLPEAPCMGSCWPVSPQGSHSLPVLQAWMLREGGMLPWHCSSSRSLSRAKTSLSQDKHAPGSLKPRRGCFKSGSG